MESTLLNKLQQMNSEEEWKNWTKEEKIQFLKIYYNICKKEREIFRLIYDTHKCDSWEHLFRDYDDDLLDHKINGVKEAIDIMEE